MEVPPGSLTYGNIHRALQAGRESGTEKEFLGGPGNQPHAVEMAAVPQRSTEKTAHIQDLRVINDQYRDDSQIFLTY